MSPTGDLYPVGVYECLLVAGSDGPVDGLLHLGRDLRQDNLFFLLLLLLNKNQRLPIIQNNGVHDHRKFRDEQERSRGERQRGTHLGPNHGRQGLSTK